MSCLRLSILFSLLFLFLVTPAFSATERGIALKPIAPTGEQVQGDTWLFVIGIDSYLSWPRLTTAVNDAKKVRDVLLERYHFDKDRLIELYDTDATRKNIMGGFVRLAKNVKPEDSVLIFYAGHGHLDPITKAGSWVPVESATDDPSAWVKNNDIKDYLNANAVQAKHILLVSDSCFAGDFFRGARGALPEVNDAVVKKAYQLSSRQALTSGGVEPVTDSGFGGNSVFSHFLVAALKDNTKPFLIPSDLFPQVKAGVAQNAEQFPQLGGLYGVGGQEGGEFVFFLKQDLSNARQLKEMDAAEQTRQAELLRLKQMEAEAAAAKQREQEEIAKKQKELDGLDQQIVVMKQRLGSGVTTGPNEGLQTMLAMVKQKEEQGRRLVELKKQREEEEAKRQAEINRLRAEAEAKRRAPILADIATYEEIMALPYGKEMAETVWQSLVSKYPEARQVASGHLGLFKVATKLVDYADQTTDMEFVLVKGGCFHMGSGSGTDREKPVHEVCVDDLYMGRTEVTQGQWTKINGSNPAYFKTGDNYPVESVSWYDVQGYISQLNSISGGKNYRLPTEAEWEYAARSGGGLEGFAGGNEVHDVAWYQENSFDTTHSVGKKKSNSMGLFDMSGNVMEWCNDLGDYDYYSMSPRVNPQGPSGNWRFRVCRGGSWADSPHDMKTTSRMVQAHLFEPGQSSNRLGFRLVFSAR